MNMRVLVDETDTDKVAKGALKARNAREIDALTRCIRQEPGLHEYIASQVFSEHNKALHSGTRVLDTEEALLELASTLHVINPVFVEHTLVPFLCASTAFNRRFLLGLQLARKLGLIVKYDLKVCRWI